MNRKTKPDINEAPKPGFDVSNGVPFKDPVMVPKISNFMKGLGLLSAGALLYAGVAGYQKEDVEQVSNPSIDLGSLPVESYIESAKARSDKILQYS